MKIPPRLSALLEQDGRLHGAVRKTLGDFEAWIGENRMQFFPAFTDHGTQHVERVMRGAESLAADSSWDFLTPSDAACLVLAVLLHDSAMHLSRDGFLHLVNRSRTWHPRGRFLDKMGDTPWPELWETFIREAMRWDARRLIAVFDRAMPVQPPVLASDAVWDDNHYLLIGEFLRRHHARLAQEIAVEGVPGPTDDRLRFTQMPEAWTAELAGFIARSHNMPLRDALALLEPNGRKVWRRVHVPYLIALLRVADYLEIDATRAPREALKVRTLRSPISRLEWKKHHAVHDIREHEGDPQALFVDAEPADVETFLSLGHLLRDMQREIDECWNALGDVYGSDADLRNLGLAVRRISSTLDDVESFAERVSYVPVDARFRVSSGEVLKLLVGPLYGEDPSYGARELIQNAVDACRELEDWRGKHPGAAVELRDQRADVVAFVEEHNDRSLTFTISDRGIGMTAKTIADYFLTAGASFRQSDAWQQRHTDDDGTSRVARSGRFGVGVLAAFLIGREVEVETRFVGSETGYRFTCRLDSSHVEIAKHRCAVGTRIRVRNELLPANAERLLGGINRLGEHWDWYAARRPSLLRGIQHAFERKIHDVTFPVGEPIWLDDQAEVPLPEDDPGPEWQRIEHKDYRAIHWSTFWPQAFWCNGIEIRTPAHRFREMVVYPDEPGTIGLQYPCLSIWDTAGNLPVSLRRDEFSAPLKLQDVLAEPVWRDLLAYLLVRLERDRARCLMQLAMSVADIVHAWTFRKSAPLSLSPNALAWGPGAHWLGLRGNYALLTHPRVLADAGIAMVLFAPDALPIDPEWLERVAEELREPLIVMQDLAWNVNASPWEQVVTQAARAEDVGELADGSFVGLTRWTVLGGEAILRPDSAAGVPAGPYRYVTFGQPGRAILREFAERTSPTGSSPRPRLALWTVRRPDEDVAAGALARSWLEIIGPRGIPLDPEQRQDELRDAYRQLEKDIRRWRVLTEKEDARRR